MIFRGILLVKLFLSRVTSSENRRRFAFFSKTIILKYFWENIYFFAGFQTTCTFHNIWCVELSKNREHVELHEILFSMNFAFFPRTQLPTDCVRNAFSFHPIRQIYNPLKNSRRRTKTSFPASFMKTVSTADTVNGTWVGFGIEFCFTFPKNEYSKLQIQISLLTMIFKFVFCFLTNYGNKIFGPAVAV